MSKHTGRSVTGGTPATGDSASASEGAAVRGAGRGRDRGRARRPGLPASVAGLVVPAVAVGALIVGAQPAAATDQRPAAAAAGGPEQVARLAGLAAGAGLATTGTPEVAAVAERQARAPVLRRGSRGEAVRAAQERLSELGYWLGEVDGSFGPVTEQAVLALQKAAGLERDGILGPNTRAALDAGVRPQAAGRGDLVEVDKARQLLLVVRGGEVVRVLNTSTGTEQPYEEDGVSGVADTPAGSWHVSWVFDGTREARLGELYRPRYFHSDGIAVHGADHVPAYPASHGCVRVSDAAMDLIWREDLMPVGSTVLVRED